MDEINEINRVHEMLNTWLKEGGAIDFMGFHDKRRLKAVKSLIKIFNLPCEATMSKNKTCITIKPI
jgi:hypothetical protein